jgi:N-acetylneuraminic acid mutarotase
MYVFGGKNEDSEKLNDLWVYNIADKKWVEINAEGEIPFERSGHSSDVYEDYLVIFGGIWDVTKELNDLHLYSFKENQWITVQTSANSPQIEKSPVRTGALN